MLRWAALQHGWLVFRYAPQAAGSGIPHVEHELKVGWSGNTVSLVIVKFFGGILSIGGGFALGREGPTIQIGGGIGQPHRTRLRPKFRRMSSFACSWRRSGSRYSVQRTHRRLRLCSGGTCRHLRRSYYDRHLRCVSFGDLCFTRFSRSIARLSRAHVWLSEFRCSSSRHSPGNLHRPPGGSLQSRHSYHSKIEFAIYEIRRWPEGRLDWRAHCCYRLVRTSLGRCR